MELTGHRTNGLGRRGCDGITNSQTDSSEINIDICLKNEPALIGLKFLEENAL